MIRDISQQRRRVFYGPSGSARLPAVKYYSMTVWSNMLGDYQYSFYMPDLVTTYPFKGFYFTSSPAGLCSCTLRIDGVEKWTIQTGEDLNWDPAADSSELFTPGSVARVNVNGPYYGSYVWAWSLEFWKPFGMCGFYE
ncbi:TPA_asm: hypothetical protein vir530_00003 [dsDNA virus vir530]|nr:TPA_asm: hypothetical protein vir530_00003 [dsDNA virus vir530]